MSSATTLSFPSGGLMKGVRNRWFGVDIGTHSVKVALVARAAEGWRVESTTIVPVGDGQVFQGDSYVNGSLVDVVRRALPSRPRLRRLKAACLLPLTAVELRTFDVPAGTNDEIYEMVRQEVGAGEDAADMEFDIWRNARHTARDEDMVSVSALIVPRRVALNAGRDLFNAGLHCQVLDGLPFTLARAVQMADPHSFDAATAAVDWGFTSVLFTLVMKGRPVYSRLFQDCGVGRLIDAVSKGLGLSFAEAEKLLSSSGGQQPSATSKASEIRRATARFAARPLRQIAEEINKTLAYLQQQPDLFPQRVWVCGGGAMFAETLAESVDVGFSAWHLPEDDGIRPNTPERIQALFGPAIALSALAGQQ